MEEVVHGGEMFAKAQDELRIRVISRVYGTRAERVLQPLRNEFGVPHYCSPVRRTGSPSLRTVVRISSTHYTLRAHAALALMISPRKTHPGYRVWNFS